MKNCKDWEEYTRMKISLTYVELTEKAGFENRNIDLMSALPGQTMESWEDTLEK